NRAVRYPYDCPVQDQEDAFETYLKNELLAEPMRGISLLDWDQDGDDDLAVWLESGQYVFFRRDDCSDLLAVSTDPNHSR
ncbi:MAG: hypothetical protein Q7S68_00945, partial [Deltaproteobacteria bacterium]|nr:hypothetical protein [Deltaproteobacteria bacterium]